MREIKLIPIEFWIKVVSFAAEKSLPLKKQHQIPMNHREKQILDHEL